MPPSILVTIIDDAKAEKCEGRCGLDFSSPEKVEEIVGLLMKLYGDRVQLEFLGLSESVADSLYPEIMQSIRARSLDLPLLLINGNIRISGYFDIHLLQNVIQTEIELASLD